MSTISDLDHNQLESRNLSDRHNINEQEQFAVSEENLEISVGEVVIHAGKTWVVKEVETLYLIKSGATSQWVRRRQIKKDGK